MYYIMYNIQDGMPTDEQSKSMLNAALKLRLSLVGSMLGTICTTDATALDWTMLLMQLICSGAVDRQTDSRSLLYSHSLSFFLSMLQFSFLPAFLPVFLLLCPSFISIPLLKSCYLLSFMTHSPFPSSPSLLLPSDNIIFFPPLLILQ